MMAAHIYGLLSVIIADPKKTAHSHTKIIMRKATEKHLVSKLL